MDELVMAIVGAYRDGKTKEEVKDTVDRAYEFLSILTMNDVVKHRTDGPVPVPPHAQGKLGFKRLYCPRCKRWTDKAVYNAKGELVHGGRRGCNTVLQIPGETED